MEGPQVNIEYTPEPVVPHCAVNQSSWTRVKRLLQSTRQRSAVISLFDMFSVGVGPSSSHTVGPMKAACRFVRDLDAAGLLPRLARLQVRLYGSLSLTGEGHMTPAAVLMGLEGESPSTIDTTTITQRVREIKARQTLNVMGRHTIMFQYSKCLRLCDEFLPEHPNGMHFEAFDDAGVLLTSAVLFSIGGGFYCDAAALNTDNALAKKNLPLPPYPFSSAAHLLQLCHDNHLTIAQIAERNEEHISRQTRRKWPPSVDAGVQVVWETMQAAIIKGCNAMGNLPSLDIPRRARSIVRALLPEPGILAQETRGAPASAPTAPIFGEVVEGCPARAEMEGSPACWRRCVQGNPNPALAMELTSAWAIAVNEENATGGRIVTAPTNGSAGVVPAVLQYYLTFHFLPKDQPDMEELAAVKTFLFTAGVVAMLFKKGASISGAEVGCQGEVGVACSMAAAGLCAVLGGDADKVLVAAEMAMEHQLGLTCDPVSGLVQVPCIERNAFGAVAAIHAAHLALKEGWGVGMRRLISLDTVIKTMLQTGRDMHSNYKETSLGGLAVNFTAC